jgi:hypothetical protein
VTATQTAPLQSEGAAVVANLGAAWRLLRSADEALPASFSVEVGPDLVKVQVFASWPDGSIDESECLAQVWALAGLLDEGRDREVHVTSHGACHVSERGRVGGLPVRVVTVLSAANPPAASATTAA